MAYEENEHVGMVHSCWNHENRKKVCLLKAAKPRVRLKFSLLQRARVAQTLQIVYDRHFDFEPGPG